MALNLSTFKQTLKNRLVSELDIPSEAEDKIKKFVDIVAEEMDTYIKTATVTVSAGIPLSTTAPATGSTTGTGTGGLS